ncbi:conserved Plasmodium protein, unknown function [Plasmodium relictum]|uniref:Uncharacterized protein n=1 Tax=Plasmodium relictum TaxID=85471 RepID=A0A1J1H9M7_PLARL|nr:conserved Plasmodium protein, unknown function [Plasmodium relictum]CRH01215.1 conserved Plasmodium protein, unknown function [Plasmodium relictum]
MINFSIFYFFMILCILKYNYALKNKKIRFFFLNKSVKNKLIIRKYKLRKYLNKINDVTNINVGELKIGKIYDIINNDIYVRLKNNNQNVIIKRENNYLLEDELLYEYLYNSNLIDNTLYNKLMKKIVKNGMNKSEINECVVLIKEINEKSEIIGELYTNEISKRKEKIYEKLNELKNSEKKIFIKILKSVRNKYFIVLIHDCIKGFLLHDKEEDMMDLSFNPKLSAYIIDVNKKLEYVFLSMKKFPENILNEKLLSLQHTILIENLFENNYFKAEISDFCNNGNNIIVNIFENKINSIKVKIKSHNIINTKNILRNFDYMKNKVIDYQFNKYNANTNDSCDDKNYKKNMQKEDFDENDIKKKNKGISKKDYYEKYKKFVENFYGCKEPDALKYIDVDNYIYKKERLIYVRIINKTSDKNMYEGSMKNSDIMNEYIYDIIKKMACEENKVSNYDEKLRYPSKVLGFFNRFVILSTRVLSIDSNDEKNNNSNNDENNRTCNNNNNIKDVVTLIEKRYIDYENLKEGDIFFCRFENVRRQSIRNAFNLSNSTINKIYNTYFRKEKHTNNLKKKNIEESIYDKKYNLKNSKINENIEDNHGITKKTKTLDQLKFEDIFFEKRNIYIMRAELHKDTEYRLNKNNIDKNFTLLKNICDTYYSGFNKSYNHYSSIREEFILRYLGTENYKLYRKIVTEYFSSNKHSYKEFLQVPCEELASTIFDFLFENPNELTVEMVKNYNKDIWERVKKLNIFELNYLLKDLIKLKNKLHVYPYTYETKTGRMNLVLNNQKPIKKEHILNLDIDNAVKEELLKIYKNFVYPIDYIRELLLIKRNFSSKENKKMPIIHILADETINIYENSAKDVEPFDEEQIRALKLSILKKKKKSTIDTLNDNDNENLNSVLFDSENSQIRKILYLIKEDLEKQKKRNKLDEVDKEYEKEQKNYIDATEIHKNIPELEEMNKLTEDIFYMKIPFVE